LPVPPAHKGGRVRINPAVAKKGTREIVKKFLSGHFWLRSRHFAPVHTVAIVGITAALAVWYLAFSAEQRATVQEFNARANNQAITMDNGIDDYWDELYSVQALVETLNQKVTRKQFETFAKALISRHPGMLNIAWAPRVTRDQRAAFELAANRDGFTDYHIRASAADGSLVVSPQRDEYFPKYYSTEAITSPVYGIDLSDGAQQRDTVEHIRDADVLSATAPLLLHTGEGDRRGFWAGLPIYARGLPHETVEERRRNVLGIVQGVFQIQVMFDTILGNIKAPVRLYLFPADAAANDPPVYFSSRLDRSANANAALRQPPPDISTAFGRREVDFGGNGGSARSVTGRTYRLYHRTDLRVAAQCGPDIVRMEHAPSRPLHRNRQ
jgi:CHASE1-domain containing sensor protein